MEEEKRRRGKDTEEKKEGKVAGEILMIMLLL